MTPKSPAPRRAALVVGCATILLLALAGSASADIPVGWSDPPAVPVLRDVLLMLGIPLLLTVAIIASVYLPSVIRGEKVAPAGSRTDDEWFGGPRQPAELEAAADRDSGGASGSW